MPADWSNGEVLRRGILVGQREAYDYMYQYFMRLKPHARSMREYLFGSYSEFDSEVMLAIFMGCRSYDPTRKAKLHTHILNAVWFSLLNELNSKHAKRSKSTIYLEDFEGLSSESFSARPQRFRTEPAHNILGTVINFSPVHVWSSRGEFYKRWFLNAVRKDKNFGESAAQIVEEKLNGMTGETIAKEFGKTGVWVNSEYRKLFKSKLAKRARAFIKLNEVSLV